MKAYYYYERDYENRPMVTHCLLNDGGKLSKGVAKCSKMDNPDKLLGRHIAFERAYQAMENNCSQMDKGKTFWKKLNHDSVFSHLTYLDKKILKLDSLSG